jgi:apolipoprotein N-acyltransferase
MSETIDSLGPAAPRHPLLWLEERSSADVPSLVALGLACLGGILLAFAYAQEPVWWAAWLAPAFLLAAALLAKRRSRRWMLLAAGLIGGTTSLEYYASVSQSWAAGLALVVARAILWTCMISVAARAAERWHSAVAVFVLPLLFAAAETLITHLSPHGAAGSYAYSQMEALALVQIASLGGSALIVAVVGLGASAAGLLIGRGLGWRGRGGATYPAALAAVAVAGAVIFGLLRLSGAPAQAEGPEVALIARDTVGGDAGVTEHFWDSYGPALDREVRPGRIVVLPEALRVLPGPAADAVASALSLIAKSRGGTIVAGFIVEHEGIRTNRALVAYRDGATAWYYKQHLVPASEAATSPGRVPLLIDTPNGKVGIAICKDMHFPSLGREYALRGASLMLVPANDFIVDAWMASRMTALRGVEGGYGIARTAGHGLMTVSDKYGRILAEQASGSDIATLVTRLPAADDEGPTIFARYGHFAGWLWIGLAALLLWQLRRQGRRTDRGLSQ